MMEHFARSLPTRIFLNMVFVTYFTLLSQLVYPPQVNLRLCTAPSMCVSARLLTVTNAWMAWMVRAEAVKERKSEGEDESM